MKIKFKLVKFEKALAFQVLEMDERFRRKDDAKDEYIFKASNLMEIISICEPDLLGPWSLGDLTICLRGTKKYKDFKVDAFLFQDNYQRDECHDKIINALREWAEKWEGWNNTESPAIDGDVFTF
jgi:hypothetical protein